MEHVTRGMVDEQTDVPQPQQPSFTDQVSLALIRVRPYTPALSVLALGIVQVTTGVGPNGGQEHIPPDRGGW